jgi:hypothetical protein
MTAFLPTCDTQQKMKRRTDHSFEQVTQVRVRVHVRRVQLDGLLVGCFGVIELALGLQHNTEVVVSGGVPTVPASTNAIPTNHQPKTNAVRWPLLAIFLALLSHVF